MAPPIPVNADFFTTNRPPTDEEHAQLTQHIQGPKTRLSELDKSISHLRKEVEALEEEERDALVAEIAPVMLALAPIRRVPEDILREIFLACLDPYRNPAMANTEAPVLLTQISSDMRRIALTTPGLWAAIHIVTIRNMAGTHLAEVQKIMGRREQAVHDWLLRSASLPLSISVFEKCDFRPSRDADNDISPMMAVICKFSLRWETLHFSCYPESLVDVLGLGLECLPLVKSVTFNLRAQRDQRVAGTIVGQSKILRAPMLTNLGLNFIAKISFFTNNVVWSKITGIHFPQIPFGAFPTSWMTDMGHILRQTTCLISCNVSIHDVFDHLDAIHLPFLKVLIINDVREDREAVGFLAAIRAPVLEAVSYHMKGDILNHTHPLIMLLKHSPSVTELALGPGQKPSYIVDCLLDCPELRTLHIQLLGEEISPDSVDEKITESAVLDALGRLSVTCPKLEHFRWSDVRDLSPSSLQKFLEKKRYSTPGSDLAKWKTVIVEFGARPDNLDIFIDIQRGQLGRDTNLYIGGSLQKASKNSNVRDGIAQLGPVDIIWPSKISQLFSW